MIRRIRHFLAFVAFVALLALLSGACGGDDDSATDDPTPTAAAEPTATADATPTPTGEPDATPTPAPDPTATTAPEPTATPAPTATPTPPAPQTINVYWAWSIETSAGTPERLGAGGRIETTATPARAAMEALLAGPNALETEIGMGSEIPPGTELLGVTISDGVATVDLSGEFELSQGTLGETIQIAQVVFTLTQFDSVDGVSFRIDGEDRDAIASHGSDVSSPLDRDDFVDVRPLILLEWPYPGASFASGDRLQGESNTFEANLQYAITDPDDLIIAEGFTTASAGNGIWGQFDVSAVLDSEVAGRGAVIVFESSAEDGSQINVVEYPIDLVGS